ncbi:MAG: hypothetical protein ACRDPO_15550 [Streptosporangiaceae bacterium]
MSSLAGNSAVAAADYGVSNRMMSWRVNATGAKAQAARRAKP